jgi:hypothetical protein
VLAAACLALNQVGEGSSPSGPTVLGEAIWRKKHGSFSGEDSAPVMRKRGFESHPVLISAAGGRNRAGEQHRRAAEEESRRENKVRQFAFRAVNGNDPLRSPDHLLNLFFDNSTRTKRTHDVAEACCLARAEARVRLPLGALEEARRLGEPPVRVLVARHGSGGFLPSNKFIAVESVLVQAGGC